MTPIFLFDSVSQEPKNGMCMKATIWTVPIRKQIFSSEVIQESLEESFVKVFGSRAGTIGQVQKVSRADSLGCLATGKTRAWPPGNLSSPDHVVDAGRGGTRAEEWPPSTPM